MNADSTYERIPAGSSSWNRASPRTSHIAIRDGRVAASSWDQHQVKVIVDRIPVHALGSGEVNQSIDRAITRELGYLGYEPEA
jgi:hypothetical protein